MPSDSFKNEIVKPELLAEDGDAKLFLLEGERTDQGPLLGLSMEDHSGLYSYMTLTLDDWEMMKKKIEDRIVKLQSN